MLFLLSVEAKYGDSHLLIIIEVVGAPILGFMSSLIFIMLSFDY